MERHVLTRCVLWTGDMCHIHESQTYEGHHDLQIKAMSICHQRQNNHVYTFYRLPVSSYKHVVASSRYIVCSKLKNLRLTVYTLPWSVMLITRSIWQLIDLSTQCELRIRWINYQEWELIHTVAKRPLQIRRRSALVRSHKSVWIGING